MKLSLTALALTVLVTAGVAIAPQQRITPLSQSAEGSPEVSAAEVEDNLRTTENVLLHSTLVRTVVPPADRQRPDSDAALARSTTGDTVSKDSGQADSAEHPEAAAGASTGDSPEDDRPAVDYPESDLFLFELKLDGSETRVGEGRNVTARPGYENQPFFRADSQSFLYSQSDSYQTDVFEYFVETGETKQLTRSANMEFSPQPSPDNSIISFVTDGEGANQSVWHFSTEKDAVQWTLEHLPEREPVGYYVWNHETGYILYWSRYGFSMRLTHESEPVFHYVTGDAVPTTPRMIPGTSKFSFVHRQGNSQVWLKELDPETLAIRPLTPLAGNNAHYDWAPDGSILMMEETTVFRWKEGETEGWQELADLSGAGMQSASRVGISPDGTMLVVVGVPVSRQESTDSVEESTDDE